MDRDRVVAVSEVTDEGTSVPEAVRRQLDVEDGDHLRWVLESDTLVWVEVADGHVVEDDEETSVLDGDEGDLLE